MLAAGAVVAAFDQGVHVVVGHGTALSWWAWCLLVGGLVALWMPVEPALDGRGTSAGRTGGGWS